MLQQLVENEEWDIVLSLKCCNFMWNGVISEKYTNRYYYTDCKQDALVPLSQTWLQSLNYFRDEPFEQRYERLVKKIASLILDFSPLTDGKKEYICVSCEDEEVSPLYDKLKKDSRFVGMDISKCSISSTIFLRPEPLEEPRIENGCVYYKFNGFGTGISIQF